MKCIGTWLLLLPHLSACFRVVNKRFATNSSNPCVNLLIIGDFGDQGSKQRKVRDSMSKVADAVDADGILALGDNVYEDGVDSAKMMEKEWSSVWLSKSGLKRKWYAVLGNHDWKKDGSEMKAFTTDSRNEGGYWQMPDYNHKATFGDVEVFMVDTEIWTGNRRRELPKSGPKDWLKSELGKSSASWKIVAGHHPVMSFGTHGGDGRMKKELDPIMRSGGANIHLSGHDHSQQHFGYKNVNYIVSGAGSKGPRGKSNDFPKSSDPKYYQGETGFAGLKICDKETATLTLYDSDGRDKYKATLRNEVPGGGGEEPSRRRGGDSGRSRGGDSRSRDSKTRRRRRRRAASLGGVEEDDLQEDEEGMDDQSDNPREDLVEVEEGTDDNSDDPRDSRYAICAGVRMTSVDLRCSDDGCKVQTDIISSEESCDDYCAAHGLVCIGAWTNDFEDCGLDVAVACDSFVMRGSQVCQCS